MKVVCIDTDIRNDFYGAPTLSEEQPLEYGKVYEGELIFVIDGKADWENNSLNLDGWSELDWFPTENFITLIEHRENKLNELGI